MGGDILYIEYKEDSTQGKEFKDYYKYKWTVTKFIKFQRKYKTSVLSMF